MSEIPPDPTIGLSIHPAPILHHSPPVDHDRHQLRIGSVAFIYFTPEIAAQWLPYLQQIADSK